MSKSGLTTATALADSSNYTHGRKGYKICKITPHHMAGVLTGKQCARIFQNPNRNASANYCIGNDGDIVCSVEEENRAWTSSSSSNDCQAITIEVSNSSTGGNWPISEKAWNSLVNLCVDICKRYGFRLNYTGDKNGSLTRHNMFANTNCPGPYLQSRFQELADTVNARLDGGQPTPTPSPEPSYSYIQFVKDVQVAEGQTGKWIDGIAGNRTLELTPTISRYKNDRNACVKPVQKYLYYLGYKDVGRADGIAGVKFDTAVKQFQRDNGCVVDGELTSKKKTWKKLLKIN